ncbi:MAG TPA: hypothetical protein VF761_06725 [Gemmatimonadaceae bacterium]
MAAVELRPRSNTELLDATVEFIRRHFVTLASAIALGQLPGLVMNALWPPDPAHPFAVWRDYPAIAVGRTVILLLVWGCWATMYVHLVDDLIHGRPATLGDALRRAIPRTLGATALYLLKYLVIILWTCLFFLPGIWAFARYFAVFPAYAIEGRGVFASIRRSKQLARGNNLRVIGVAGIPGLLVMVLMLVVQQAANGMGASPRALGFTGAIASTVLYPFMSLPAIFLYYDIRTRREGLDLDVAHLPSSPTPSPSPSAAA